MKKVISLTLLTLILLIISPENNNVKAANQEKVEKYPMENYSAEFETNADEEKTIDLGDRLLIFDTVEGKEAYEDAVEEHGQEYMDNNVSIQKEIPGLPKRLINSEQRYGVFGGYITSAWAKADSYYYEQGSNFKFSASQQVFGTNVSVNFTHSTTAGINIPADASRSSRLGHEADILFERYRQNPPNLSRSHEFTEITYSNPQFVVYYQ